MKIIKGGQGRTPEELKASAIVFGFCCLAGWLLIISIVIFKITVGVIC